MTKKSFLKQATATVGAGVLGSALTLGAVWNVDALQLKTETPTVSSSSPLTPVHTTTEASIADMVENTSKGIVGITRKQEMTNPYTNQQQMIDNGVGSGVIYKKDQAYAYIVTNNHVIENGDTLTVSFASGQTTEGTVVGHDALTDLAVIKVDAKYAEVVLPFGDSTKVRTGEAVIAIGNPLGLDFSGTVTRGVISAAERTIDVETSAGTWAMDVLQTDAAINPGNSGGALLNDQGEIIGINTLKIAKDGVEGLGFAIPSEEVQPIIEELMQNGEVTRGYLGIHMANLDQLPPQWQVPVKQGAYVAEVDPQSEAAKAGLQAGDILTAFNKEPILDASTVRQLLYKQTTIGDQVTLTFIREGKTQQVAMTIAKKPA